MEAIRSSDTSGTTQRTTWRHIPEEDTLQVTTFTLHIITYITQSIRLVMVGTASMNQLVNKICLSLPPLFLLAKVAIELFLAYFPYFENIKVGL
jgi:hypothetical protein